MATNIAARTKEALAIEWPTLMLYIVWAVGWGIALFVLPWALAALVMVPLLTLHSSLSHEILHGHPFNAARANTALGLWQPGLFVPYLRFRDLHLAHHRDEFLTDPYDDPETNYLCPQVWAGLPAWLKRLCVFNNTLLGRMLVGPLIGMVHFVADDIRAIRRGDRAVLLGWLAHLPGVALTLWLVTVAQMPLWAYVLACYGALSILKIRTFLEHQAHLRVSGRTVVIEDRGILAFLFLNNNFHVVHHMNPGLAWYRLPALYREQKDRFLRRNHGYRYGSYREIFATYLLRCKDPVAHPHWKPD